MNTELIILIVEDEPDVLDAIVRDVEEFEPPFRIEATQSAEEASKLLKELESEDVRIALMLCDHVLTGESGVDFMSNLAENEQTKGVRKVLITGQAGHEDTINAINSAGLHHYIAKPWKREDLQEQVRHQITNYVIDQKIQPLPFMSLLETERLAEYLRTSSTLTDL